MRSLGLVAAVFLTTAISSCGGNSTAIGVTVTAVGSTCQSNCSAQAPAVVIKGQTETFAANVSGGSTTTVYWQICLKAPVTSPPTQPTTCTAVPGTTNIPAANQTLTGYGTITQTGLYTAPQTLPQNNPFVVMASSTANYADFGVSYVEIDSGIRVQMIPTTATIATGENYTLTASVTGTTNTGLTWSVNDVAGGSSSSNIGTITPTGPQTAVYSAPTTAITADVTATSVADTTQSASATITVQTAADPTISSIDPSIAQQGSAQQDIYIIGTNFYSTSTVTVQGVAVVPTWINGTLMRVTLTAAQLAQAGTFPIQVISAGNLSPVANLTVNPMRPSVVATAIDSIPANTSGFGLNVSGGYFTADTTTANFNSFSAGAVGTSISSSRQLLVNLPAGAVETPGLYSIVVQNSGLPVGVSSTSAVNLAVTPVPGTLLTSPTATVTVGSAPSAIAIDQADGLALVANTGSNSVSIINLTTLAVTNVAVGNSPTGVAVDDALLAPLHHLALVVNNADNTVSVIDLSTLAVTQTLSLTGLTPNTLSSPSAPYSVAINPITHRGFIADTTTNSGTVIDMVTPNPTLSCATAPCPVAQIGGPPSSYGTGTQPQISVDPQLNWAVVSAGGAGIGLVNMVDLGRAAIPGVDPGRQPSVVAAFAPGGSSGVAGLGVNPETHQVLLTIPSNGNFTTFSLLDQAVNSIPFVNQGVTVNQPGYVAAAVSSLSNVGVAVNSNANTAAILDLQNRLVIENVTTGTSPVAVAIDSATNQALVANQTDGTVSVISLGAIRSSAGASQVPQITLAGPEITYTSTSPLTLTLNGGGFAAGAQAFLDGTALASTVSANGRQIIATVPASMLSSARRYSVYVQNSVGAAISNIEPLIVVQEIAVGNAPFGVALDTDCDVAAVTNSADDTVSIIALTALPPPVGKTCASNGAVGTVGAPVSVGATPEGIDIEPRFGIAVVADTTGPSTASVVDVTEMNPPTSIALCGGACTDVAAVAFNHDTSTAEITSVSAPIGGNTTGQVTGVTVSLSASGVPAASAGGQFSDLDLTPTDVAVDPYIQYLGVTTAGQTSAVDIVNLEQNARVNASGLTGLGVQVPSGIIFDPLNQVFVVANSLVNNVIFVDPTTQLASSAQVGVNPTSLDYDYQNSTLVTANNASNTLSILDYVCPPSILNTCSGPIVREILPFSGSPQFSIKIDARLNLAILADEANNRVLLIPLP